jgi:hypothetical protein
MPLMLNWSSLGRGQGSERGAIWGFILDGREMILWIVAVVLG